MVPAAVGVLVRFVGCRLLELRGLRMAAPPRLPRRLAGADTRERQPENQRAFHFASGSVLTWKWTALLCVPLPPSSCHGVRLAQPVHSPLPFQPAFASSIRPLTDLL